jgi:hypothetical protein
MHFTLFITVKFIKLKKNTMIVATLALGSRPRQGLAKVRAKNETWESHFMFVGV